MIPIRIEVMPFLLATILVFGLPCLIFICLRKPLKRLAWICGLIAVIITGYLLYFFRDPERVPPLEPKCVLASADGRVASITRLHESQYLKTDCVRISIFLSLFDVHVNRAPFAGNARFLGYFPGKRFFTFDEKSSDFNQHNKILIEGPDSRCLLTQIVGPVCRRVVYWPDHDSLVPVAAGERIGMMKFGSRLDLYLPESDVDVLVQTGQEVRAGETILAQISKQPVAITTHSIFTGD